VIKLLLSNPQVNPQDALLSAVSTNNIGAVRELCKHPKTEPNLTHTRLAEHKRYKDILEVLNAKMNGEEIKEYVPSPKRDYRPNSKWCTEMMENCLREIDEEMAQCAL
jgi:hypothetical protein